MNTEMEKDILKVLVTEEELKARVEELGQALYDPLCRAGGRCFWGC